MWVRVWLLDNGAHSPMVPTGFAGLGVQSPIALTGFAGLGESDPMVPTIAIKSSDQVKRSSQVIKSSDGVK